MRRRTLDDLTSALRFSQGDTVDQPRDDATVEQRLEGRGGTWVVSDRSSLSTVVYQGHGHGVDLAWTRDVCALARSRCEPDLELVLALDEATAAARRTDRGTTDRFERLDEAFHRRVGDGYRIEAAERDLPVVDAAGTPDEVLDRIWPHVELLR